MTQLKNRAGVWFCVLNGPVFSSTYRVPDDLKPVIFWGLPSGPVVRICHITWACRFDSWSRELGLTLVS